MWEVKISWPPQTAPPHIWLYMNTFLCLYIFFVPPNKTGTEASIAFKRKRERVERPGGREEEGATKSPRVVSPCTTCETPPSFHLLPSQAFASLKSQSHPGFLQPRPPPQPDFPWPRRSGITPSRSRIKVQGYYSLYVSGFFSPSCCSADRR